MNKELFELDEFINAVLQTQDHQLDFTLQSVHSVQTSQQNLIQLSQKQMEMDVSPDLNQFLSFQQHQNNFDIDIAVSSNQSSKPRKKRIQLDINMIEEINYAFNKLQQNDNPKCKNQLTLKKIAEKLNLSYLTVMRKYRQFKQYRVVPKGVKLQTNKNRSYKKTQEMHQIIQQCMQERDFTSASQLGYYIKDKYGKQFSRFQIRSYMKKNKQKEMLIDSVDQGDKKKSIYNNFLRIIEDKTAILFFAEVDYFSKDLTSLTISLICGQRGLQFLVDKSSEKRAFDNLLGCYLNSQSNTENWVIVSGKSQLDKQRISQLSFFYLQTEPLLQMVDQKRVKYYCLPPGLETFNLAKNILIRNSVEFYKPQQFFLQEITAKLQAEKKKFSLKTFSQFTSQLSIQTVGKLNQKYS